jgi:hypothetical protein
MRAAFFPPSANRRFPSRKFARPIPHFGSEESAKEHATLSAGASVDHGFEVGITGEHVNRAADRGCCVSSCWASSFSEVEALVSSFARRITTDFDYTGDEVIDSYATGNELITLVDTESL